MTVRGINRSPPGLNGRALLPSPLLVQAEVCRGSVNCCSACTGSTETGTSVIPHDLEFSPCWLGLGSRRPCVSKQLPVEKDTSCEGYGERCRHNCHESRSASMLKAVEKLDDDKAHACFCSDTGTPLATAVTRPESPPVCT